jgi:hypothetical protein
MSDFRKQMHVAYKKKMLDILGQYTLSLLSNYEQFSKDPEEWAKKWINANCLPMGDFSKKDALKEINGWVGEEKDL